MLERTEDHVGEPRARLGVPAGDGCGERAVHDGAGRRDDRERPVAALVARDRRVGQVEEGVVDRGGGDGVDRVDRADRLGRRAREVGYHLAAVHGERQLHRIVAVGDAVVLDRVLERVRAVRDRLDLGAHPPLGDRHQLVGRGLHEVEPVVRDQRVDPPFGHVE